MGGEAESEAFALVEYIGFGVAEFIGYIAQLLACGCCELVGCPLGVACSGEIEDHGGSLEFRDESLEFRDESLEKGGLDAFYLFDSLDGAEFFEQGFEAGVVVDHDGEVAAEESVVGVDVDGAEDEFLVL